MRSVMGRRSKLMLTGCGISTMMDLAVSLWITSPAWMRVIKVVGLDHFEMKQRTNSQILG